MGKIIPLLPGRQKIKKKKNFALFGKIGCFSCTKTNGFSLMVDLIEIVSIKDYNWNISIKERSFLRILCFAIYENLWVKTGNELKKTKTNKQQTKKSTS